MINAFCKFGDYRFEELKQVPALVPKLPLFPKE